jgi:chorismate synthase
VDGCPPGLPLDAEDIQRDVERRRSGKSRHVSQRREPDQVRIMSGVFEGLTTGAPIGLVVENVDAKSKDYAKLAELFRPGHADYTWARKYGFRDHRGGGRSSARETVMRVAAGAIARKYLATRLGIEIRGWLAQLGPIRLEPRDLESVDDNPFFCPDPARVARARGLHGPAPQVRRLDRRARQRGRHRGAAGPRRAGVRQARRRYRARHDGHQRGQGVEIGDGFAVVEQKGTEHRDEMTPEGFLSNHAGGTLGGISSGQAIRVSMALKPTSSLRLPGRTVNVRGEAATVVTTGRHDPCVGVRATPIAEAMLALVLMDHVLRDRAQNADVVPGAPLIPDAPG